MSATTRGPAISGVSSGKTTEVMRIHPSIAGTAYGRLLGQVLDSIPIKIGGVKLSHLLFGLPAALLALPMFFILKAVGEVYSLTNRSVQIRTCLSNRPVREILFAEISDVVIRQLPGQQFYPAAEIDLMNKAGDTLMTLSGIPRADVFRQTILEARNSRNQVQSSLTTIRARHAG
jgi:Bacterial PH domain